MARVDTPVPARGLALVLADVAGRNLHEKVANALGQDIVAGVYPPGTPLPTEMGLCAALAVSRSALREAFKLLAAKRLIVSRQKIGTVVRPREEWNLLDPDLLAWHLRGALSEDLMIRLFEVRGIVEPAAAALAAERHTEAALANLAAALEAMAEPPEPGACPVGADLRFHQGILAATANPFLTAFGGVLESALAGTFALHSEIDATASELSLGRHRAVFDAIARHRRDEAAASMSALLADARDEALVAVRRNAPGVGRN